MFKDHIVYDEFLDQSKTQEDKQAPQLLPIESFNLHLVHDEYEDKHLDMISFWQTNTIIQEALEKIWGLKCAL